MPDTVVIYRDRLLLQSETFILAQAEALRRFTAFYVGCRREPGLQTPEDRTLVINKGQLTGSLQEIMYKEYGHAPSLINRVASLHPRLVHAHFGPDGVHARSLSGSLNLPLVVTFHGYDATTKEEAFLKTRVGRRYIKNRQSLAHSSARLLAVSDFIKHSVVVQGMPAEKIHVHYTGVDTDLFSPDASVVREPMVLFVGRLVEKKGCEYLIRAMAEVCSAMPKAVLLVVGDGPLRGQLEQDARSRLLSCRFLGAQSNATVQKLMRQATVFSVPSVTAKSGDAEGFGMVFVEAQACGTPVVSFATGGIPEAVAHGETGFLAPEYDCKKLAEYILVLLENREVWTQFSKAARRRVLSLFDLKKQTELLEDMYEQLASA